MKSLLLVFLLAVTFAESSPRYEKYQKLIAKIAKSPLLQKSFESNLRIFGGEAEKSEFPCEILPPSPTVPTSVHQLRPGDIKIVAALGDSLTAGNGITAKTILGVLREDRGESFSIGGDGTFEDQITIPNILKRYNPSITGYSTRSGDIKKKNSAFNVADPGNVFMDLTDEAELLISRMQADPNIDINNDWKLITILIGDNDLCDICDEDGHEAERYIATMEKTLQILQDNLPRTIVNVVEVLNANIVKKLNKGLICSVVHFFLCKCAAYPKNDVAEQELINMTRLYQTSLHDLAISGKFDTKDDFTVVDQPFFRNTYPPTKAGSDDLDLSYFVPDCFHLSSKGQSNTATALWNNMFQPVGQKTLNWELGNTITCPTEQNPHIYTNKNSGDGQN
ncbi:hypothetical protein SNE40_008546 [Patella caerulea]|uniref:Phospholipase B1, membrane-associated n=1 Tax=Patella caerulea TaxID=87958 RepID=A0AAN8Q3T2_PATCE